MDLLAKISENNDGLVIEMDNCFIKPTDEYKDVISAGDNVWITFDCARVSSFDKDTITFTYDDMKMYKVYSSAELLEMYGGIECSTYYIAYYIQGMGTYYDNRFEPAIGYYNEALDISFIADALYPYDYFEEDIWSHVWYSPYEEEDDLYGKNRYLEIYQSDIGLGTYKQRFDDYHILY